MLHQEPEGVPVPPQLPFARVAGKADRAASRGRTVLPEPATRRITTPELMLLLNREHGVGLAYRTFWDVLMTGAIPAERGPDGRTWTFDPADVPAIAALLRARRENPPRPGPRPRPR